MSAKTNTLIVNLFGAPGSGKSTGAAYVFSRLKMQGINAELVTEFAKDLVWENNLEALHNQAYVFGTQYLRLSRCLGKAEVIITDSPLPLSLVYNKDEHLNSSFNHMVMDTFNSLNNINFYIERSKPYQSAGRLQTSQEASEIASSILNLLSTQEIPVAARVSGDTFGYNQIVNRVLSTLRTSCAS